MLMVDVFVCVCYTLYTHTVHLPCFFMPSNNLLTYLIAAAALREVRVGGEREAMPTPVV